MNTRTSVRRKLTAVLVAILSAISIRERATGRRGQP